MVRFGGAFDGEALTGGLVPPDHQAELNNNGDSMACPTKEFIGDNRVRQVAMNLEILSLELQMEQTYQYCSNSKRI